ncbi:SpoIIE family protein phosphatase [Streptomyces sp. WAC 00631]|uniref:ATP-binding SpoIIE family protein phosphatase n=1 Tax=Streptomyces sp. WAC 00631 TaxID=2203201 RepID=UPI000F77EAB0|nr:SpoIIE family protein phosphatase [Streptomyces sp. WAC 00631]MCC5032467.1 SpoIIE family protein phosphatase [Streptomyces sp. WAC 00631]
MRSEDVLSATATGLWRWDTASKALRVDAEAARLLGFDAIDTTLSPGATRARFHPVDWVEMNEVVSLALTEGTLAEVLMRVIGDDGRVLRRIRVRARPHRDAGRVTLIGTVQELPEEPRHADDTAAPPRVTGDWRRAREAFLLDAGRALAEARSTSEVLRVAGNLSMPGFSPNGLVVFTVEGDWLKIVGFQGDRPDDEEPPFEEMPLDTPYPAAEVVRTGRAVYLSSPGEFRERYPLTWPLVSRFDLQSWAYVPLITAGRTTGAWLATFDHRVAFTPDERSILATVARMLAQALSRAGTQESQRELAVGLQRAMLPPVPPETPGMTVAARYVPTGGGLQIGGDWYDMIPLPSDRVAFVVGDVQGHDVRAASLMTQLRIALRAYASEGHHPDAVLSRGSRFLAGLADRRPDGEGGEDDPRFATVLYIEADPASGTLDIARAGHQEPVTRMYDGTMMTRTTAGGLPLGVSPDADYPITRIVLEPGELMMLFTDGLLETGGHNLETGWQRLREAIEEHVSEDMETMADSVIQAVHGPTSHYRPGPLSDRREDDIVLLLLCRNGPGCGAPALYPLRQMRRTVMTIAQAEPERISLARRQLRELMHDWSDPEQVDSAELMLSEMVTNVLVHTDGDAVAVAEITAPEGDGSVGRRLRVDVADSSDELPHRRRPGELASSGRGLVLLELLAHAWGVDPRGEGKTTWFELYENPGPPGPDEPEPRGPLFPEAVPDFAA